MTATLCPHGLNQRTCEICRVLETGSTTPSRDRDPRLVPRLQAKSRLGLGVGAVVVIVILVIVTQVIAVVWSVLHLLQIVGAAALAGWIGWKLGVVHGRRSRP